MIKLSSIIIAKNEESNIARCIESQLNCVDEIFVLVDNTTTDNTLEIIKSYGNVKYRTVEWQGYAKTKQLAVSLVSYDWIIWIDADEALTAELKNELLKFKESKPSFPAYSIPRKAYFLGKWIKHSGWYPGRVTRLFNQQKAYFNNKDVHENLHIEGETGKLNADLEHYTDPSISHYFFKFNNYTTLAADELLKKGKKFSVSDILIRPIFIFIKMYFIKRGFLDGLQGFILAVFSSAYVFTKYSKLWELKESIKHGTETTK